MVWWTRRNSELKEAVNQTCRTLERLKNEADWLSVYLRKLEELSPRKYQEIIGSEKYREAEEKARACFPD